MTTTDENGTDSRPRVRNGSSTDGGYEWTCPYCGQSRFNTSDGEGGEENAIAALRSHIFASDDPEHGPRNEGPTDGNLALADHVVRVDGRQ